MKPTSWIAPFAAGLALGALALTAGAQDKAPGQPDPEGVRRWMESARPGAQHKSLERFVGAWDTVTRMWMQGPGGPAVEEKGTATHTLVLAGRFVRMEGTGTFARMPFESFSMVGYDNFRKHWVTTWANSTATGLYHADGAAERDGSAIHFYGEIDEPMDGTVGKKVRATWRFPAPDKLLMEVHDLDIGERDTKVFEIEYTRRR